MAQCIGRWNGKVIGSSIDAESAVSGSLDYLGCGAFRTAYIDAAGVTVYKVTGHRSEDDENVREYGAESALAKCGCVARAYAAPTALWRTVSGRMVIAQPYYAEPGWVAARDARNAFAHNVRAHNAAGHAPTIADMQDSNYRVTRARRIVITDMNLDADDYDWLVETDTTGRL